VAKALRRLASKRWIDERLSALSATNPYLAVNYEDFLASNRETVMALVTFLGCDPTDRDLRLQARKHRSRPARTASRTSTVDRRAQERAGRTLSD
jgi:hypothetical protein